MYRLSSRGQLNQRDPPDLVLGSKTAVFLALDSGVTLSEHPRATLGRMRICI
jgi:hypothetical protein